MMSESISSTYEVRVLAVDRTTLYRWLEKFDKNGYEGLTHKEGSGRPRLLEKISETDLMNIVLASATQLCFESDLWTVGRLHQVMTKAFHAMFPKIQSDVALSSQG